MKLPAARLLGIALGPALFSLAAFLPWPGLDPPAARAAGIVASYQVLVKRVPAEEAYRELDRYGSRPVAESQLLPFLNENMEEIAILLAERKVIDSVPDPLPRFVPPD